ncbi:cellulase family glycosylhydrolase [Butyrivibrio sp. MC2013]|uniref:cellulase family glycosylhydrolase n=1 Tax=Butyrivibrio sp. MC2013 TaxID=1280686 RepID=UPI00042488E5|nr:cellulase family glycosylhydrolase [Butyrivibrio sp. MC2013]
MNGVLMKFMGGFMAAALSVTSIPASVSENSLAEPAAVIDSSSTVFSEFVTADGTKLMEGDRELQFISLNYPQATSDNEWEHANAIKTIKTMGGRVTRTYTIPVYNGQNAHRAYVTGVDENGNLTFNEDALNELDDVLAKCNEYGVRVVVPLVDHWHWVGGIDGYVYLAGENDGAPSNSSFQDWAWKFYSSPKCLDYFEQMITHLLNRVNTVTGVKYMDDPAILCWETANEAGGNQSNQIAHDDELSTWNKAVVEHIKSIDHNHLVLDGRMSTTERSRSDENPADILGAHYYEGNYATRCADDTRLCHEAGKPFILGEFGAKVTADPCIDVFQAGVDNGTNGIMMWSLRAHKDGFGYYFHDEDGYWAAYHWPGFEAGDYYGETEILRAIYAYAQVVNGAAADYEEARNIPIPAPETDEAPLLYESSMAGGSVADIKWRGVVGGAWYEVERADGRVSEAEADSAEWTLVCDKSDKLYDSGRNREDKAHDCMPGFHDETAIDGQTYSYRLRAANESGYGLWSNIVTVENVNHLVNDPLDMISVSSTDNNPTEIRRTYSYDHSRNVECPGSYIVNKSDSEGYIEYKASIAAKTITVNAASEPSEENAPKIAVSNDGIRFTQLETAHESGSTVYVAEADPASCYGNYVRVYLPGKSACKLEDITILYVNDGGAPAGEPAPASPMKNVIIQDNQFGENGADPLYVYKDDETLVYKTLDDINAYRVIAYCKNGKEPLVEYSYDGSSFNKVPLLKESEENGEKRLVYGDLNVSDMVRVIRVTVAKENKDDIRLSSVELSSGKKSIPLADEAPANSLEDGEYYFGQDSTLEAAYTVSSLEDGSGLCLEKNFSAKDMSAYDSIYAYLEGDGSDNKLTLSFTDAKGLVWESEEFDLSSRKASMKKALLGSFTTTSGADPSEMDLTSVSSFAIAIKGANGENALARIRLDKNKAYSGNYAIAIDYSMGGNDYTIYLDSIYMASSTRVDDFEGYSGSSNLLGAAYSRNTNGGKFDLALDTAHKSEGSYGMRIDYDYNGKGYAGVTKKMDLLNLAGYDGFVMFIDSDGSGNDIKVQIETDVSTFSYTGFMTGKGPTYFYMPFSAIKEESWAGSGHVVDSTANLKSVSIYSDQKGEVSAGTFYVDDIRGANFVADLESKSAVTIDSIEPAAITAFPFTISGTADFVQYVSVVVGDKTINVPVNADGSWTCTIDSALGILNGEDIAVKAGVYYPNGDVITETSGEKISINVEGNDPPYEEKYEDPVWTWDFATDGKEGWTFEGFDPWVENSLLVAWSQTGYDAVFSKTITGLENGTYTLSNDIKVKSNMKNVQVALKSGETEVVSDPIDTADVVVDDRFIDRKIEVANGELTIIYRLSSPTDSNGTTFAAGDLKLYQTAVAEPEDPEDPGQGEITDPTDPEDPGQGEITDPTDPEDPGQGEITDPTDPTDPADPGNGGAEDPGHDHEDHGAAVVVKIVTRIVVKVVRTIARVIKSIFGFLFR